MGALGQAILVCCLQQASLVKYGILEKRQQLPAPRWNGGITRHMNYVACTI
jgi:hypothetical protein